MNIKRGLMVATALVALCGAGLASAVPATGIGPEGTPPGHGGCPPGQAKKGKCGFKAPEIDATAGVQAIALLTGLLLLVGERSRRRNA